MGRMWIAVGLAVAVLAGCERDRATTEPASPGASRPLVEISQQGFGPKADQWWVSDAPCPDGAELRACGQSLPPSVFNKVPSARTCDTIVGTDDGMLAPFNPYIGCAVPDGSPHGRVSYWQGEHGPYLHGAREDSHYVDGQQRGPWTAYRESGARNLDGTYDERGLQHGTVRQWSGDGKLLGRFEMKHGTGLWTTWKEDGHESSARSYVAGIRDGPVYEWVDGARLQLGSYRQGERHGEWTFYFRSGNKFLEENYNDGVVCGTKKYWNESGVADGTEEHKPCGPDGE